jgi:thiol-disulfide isomerase/thioredoxin
MYIGLSDAPPARTAAQIYGSQSKIRELTDANFWNIFYDRDKVMVVAFWATSCQPCKDVAEAIAKVADRCYKGPHGRVKFYHVQWDRKVNPKIQQWFGFGSVPVVFFYYTSTGKPPTRECPLLEASLPRRDRLRDARELRDPEKYLVPIRDILRRHPRINELFQAIDFYDHIDPHLGYLGRLYVPSCRNSSQIRLIGRADLARIYDKNRKPKTTMSDWAANLPGTPAHRKLFPQATDPHAHVEYDFVQIEHQTQKTGLTVQVGSMDYQAKQLNALFNNAKKSDKEQGLYIVLEIKNNKARLYFERAIPLTSARDEFEFKLDCGDLPDGRTIRYVPGDRYKQVIGTLHTHYVKSTPIISQTTTQGVKILPGGELVERIVPGVSKKDIRSAICEQIVVYAMEVDQIHKAIPNGRAINGITRPFNVLVDALESFGRKIVEWNTLKCPPNV